MIGRIPTVQGRRGVARAIVVATLATIVLLAAGLSGCSKKEQPVQTDPTLTQAPKPVEPVEVPKADIPVVDDTPKPEEVMPADLGLKDVYFDFDKYELSKDAQAALNADGRIMKEVSGAQVVIEGHCDERGTVQYNLALGEKRARAARDYLVDLGVDPNRLEIVSYGKERPFAQGHDEAAWAQNRRAHFVPRQAAK